MKRTKSGLVTVGELVKQLKRFSPKKGVIFTEGLHSDVFDGVKKLDRNTVKIRVR